MMDNRSHDRQPIDIIALMRRQQYWELGGGDDVSPLDDAIEMAIRDLAELQALKSHRHEWSEDGFCHFCGWDGNA